MLARLSGGIAFERKDAIRPMPSLDRKPPSESGESPTSPWYVPDARCERADLGRDVLGVAQSPRLREPVGEREPRVDHHSWHDEVVCLGPDPADPLATFLQPIDAGERLANSQRCPQRGLMRKRSHRGCPCLGGLECCEQVAILHSHPVRGAENVDV